MTTVATSNPVKASCGGPVGIGTTMRVVVGVEMVVGTTGVVVVVLLGTVVVLTTVVVVLGAVVVVVGLVVVVTIRVVLVLQGRVVVVVASVVVVDRVVVVVATVVVVVVPVVVVVRHTVVVGFGCHVLVVVVDRQFVEGGDRCLSWPCPISCSYGGGSDVFWPILPPGRDEWNF